MSNAFKELKLDYDAVGMILKSDEMMKVVDSFAKTETNDLKNIKEFVGFDRVHALVFQQDEDN